MPNSMFKERPLHLNSRVAKCPFGQTFDFASERDQDMKLRMLCKVCSKPAESSRYIRASKKAMMLEEPQLNEAERVRMVHEHHW